MGRFHYRSTLSCFLSCDITFLLLECIPYFGVRSLRNVNNMVNHTCEPIQSTCSGSDQTAQDGDRAPLTALQSKADRPADKAIFTYSKREDRPAERGTVPL